MYDKPAHMEPLVITSYSIHYTKLYDILTMGEEGLKQASQLAVLNANYIKEQLKGRG